MITKEQAQERKNYLGSSDAAAVLGLSRWQTPLQIWAIKTGQIEPREPDSEAVKLGRELEDYVAKRFMEVTGKKVKRRNTTLFDKEYSFLGANIDRKVVGENAVLECKTTSAWLAKEWEGEDIPQEYVIQVLHQMMVGRFSKGYIAVLIGNQSFKWKEIPRDETLIEDIKSKEVYFWKEFVEKKQMPMTIKAHDSDVLYKLFPQQVEESVIELDDEAQRICEFIKSMEEEKKDLEKQIEEQRNILKAMLKTYETGQTAGYKITWKTQVTRRLDVETFKSKMPTTYERFLKEVSYRVLRISEKKKG